PVLRRRARRRRYEEPRPPQGLARRPASRRRRLPRAWRGAGERAEAVTLDAASVREGLALFALCWLLAKVEIEIEGDQGWAVGLPTWRWGPEWWLNLTNGKAVTGYHVWLTLFLIGVFHLPLVFAGFSRELWAKCASSYLILTSAWDLQWFAWNPAWGLRKFRATPIPWF